MDFSGKTVVLGVTGGIAAYKACDLVSRLHKKHINIRIIMTEHACEFVQPLTFEVLSGNRVVTDMFNRDFPWEVEHISLAKAADVFAVVPATANILGKYAHGIADDMLSTTLLATRAPVLFAPAMNTAMYENPAVQQNIMELKQRGCLFVEPASGMLACGDTGKGKLADVDTIEQAILDALTQKDMTGMRITVTAGPTREAMDPVRFLSNHSTGKMGYAIAENAMLRGADVTLVTGPCALEPPMFVKVKPVISAQDMYEAVTEEYEQTDIVIMTAAVADYRPAQVSTEKVKKQDGDMSIPLTRTKDILAT
ncbi:MAG: bifunctional phosphopantothenoylcysteine decarboxylase/phosphopantothenate--cysteine ligase CoaBC, partial [Butyricicoccus sp.]|nr:bifunctional phosphopantothenoylcysteine decarboxylase/phosphopantothenate--cysteine ligase CoaBC [Butyricicoccus sp.]